MEIWLTFLAAGLVTFLTRLSFIQIFARRDLPPALLRLLRFVPPAVLSAIVLPELLVSEGSVQLGMGNLRLLAGLIAALVAWRTRSVVPTIAAGMVALWILQVVFG